MAPPADGLGDDRAGGDEPACGAPDADQDQEDHAVHDRAAGADVGEDGYVDADVVAAVGESGGGDLEDRRAAWPGFGPLAAVTGLAVLPGFPGVPQAEGDREQAEVGQGFLGRNLAPRVTAMATARIAVKARYWPAITRLAEPRWLAPCAKNSDKITMSSKLVTANSPTASAMTPAVIGA